MQNHQWTDEHARLVAQTAPPSETPSAAETERVWNLVAAVVEAPAAKRRPRRRMTVGVGVAAIVLGASGVAAADIWSARTGTYNTDAESIRLGGPGEFIDPRGDDFEKVLLQEIADIPFPSEDARGIAVAEQVINAKRSARSMRRSQAQGRSDWREVMITGGMRAEAARQAVCAWSNVWAAATTAGDGVRRAEAIEVLEASRSWPAVTDVDSEQKYTWEPRLVTHLDGKTSNETVRHETPFAFLPLVVDAAHERDIDAMGETLLKNAPCLLELMPDLPGAAVPPELLAQ